MQNSSDSDDLASEVFVQQPTELPCGLTDLSYSSDPSSEYPFRNVGVAFLKHEPRNVAFLTHSSSLVKRSVREK